MEMESERRRERERGRERRRGGGGGGEREREGERGGEGDKHKSHLCSTQGLQLSFCLLIVLTSELSGQMVGTQSC